MGQFAYMFISLVVKLCVILLTVNFALFCQHIDDHSIIMADQTVIKKGTFI